MASPTQPDLTQPQQNGDPAAPGWLSRAASSFAGAVGAPPKLSDYLEGPKQLIEHPIDSAKLLGSAALSGQTDVAKQGLSEMKTPGHRLEGAMDYAESGVPFVGPALSHASHQMTSGDIAGGIGTTLGTAAGMLGSRVLPGEHPQVASEALQEHTATGGSTYEPTTGQNLAGSRKLTVGIAPEHTAISEQPFTPEQYSNFVATHRDLLQRHPSVAVGTHFDPETGMHSMELVGTTSSTATAQNLATHLGEHHVYNLATDKILPTGVDPNATRSPSPLSVDERVKYLNENSPQKETYSGTHYSDAGLDTISGSRRGVTAPNAVPGAESARLRLGTKTGQGPDAPGGFYTHTADSLPDPRMAGKKNAYGIRGQFAFASTDGPEFQQGYASGVQRAIANGADMDTAHKLGLNSAENAVKDAGYDGYHTPKHPDTRFHFGDAQATPVASKGGQTFYDGTNAEGARAIKKAGTVAGHPDVLKQGFIGGPTPDLKSALSGPSRGEPLEHGYDHEIATGPDLGAQVRGKLPKPSTRTSATNGSGESAASQEAINRVSQEKSQGISRVAVDTHSGVERPLIGVDAVDYQPRPHESVEFRGGNRDGESISQGSAARPYNRANASKPSGPTAGTQAGADADTAFFQRAKEENPAGSFSSWAQRAQELKDGKAK